MLTKEAKHHLELTLAREFEKKITHLIAEYVGRVPGDLILGMLAVSTHKFASFIHSETIKALNEHKR